MIRRAHREKDHNHSDRKHIPSRALAKSNGTIIKGITESRKTVLRDGAPKLITMRRILLVCGLSVVWGMIF